MLFSLFIGFILALIIFYNLFLFQYRGPSSDYIRKQKYKINNLNQCYKFEPVIKICPYNAKHI